jgi:spore coat polysaccharide biosynthesis protein SpsF (cytidylyltransferase family)/sialic acid synthase SpsE
MLPYQILEVANCHGGKLDYVLSLLDEFKIVKQVGMKFQPLHPDRISTKDYPWHKVYQELFFGLNEWKIIFEKAKETKDIWIDIFDTYGVDVLINFKNDIKGIKLQSSIIYNQTVIDSLKLTKLNEKILIINISALQLNDIEERLNSLKKDLSPLEIWLEVGFQSYPTELLDCAYVKIKTIKDKFKCKVVFADHVDGKSDDAIWLPVMAALNGADVIEKHIKHSVLDTPYDYFSSVDINSYNIFLKKTSDYLNLKSQPFINDRERAYLNNTIQIPISSKKIKSGELINMSLDVDFKRSNEIGLNTKEIFELQKNFHILSSDIEIGKSFLKENFKKSTIATIVACRLKSSRLEKKALLKIGDITSVEKCLQSCLQFSDIHYTILATSTNEQDEELEKYTYNPQVIFHRGSAEDVINRYIDISEKLNIDVIVRVTADMPYVSSEITEILLKSHFETGADYTVSKNVAVGSGVEIINLVSLIRIRKHFNTANYSEYMTWYFQNNPDYFKLNFVELPIELIRDYRLTLDYKEDLDLFNIIQKYLDDNSLKENIFNIYKFLDENPNISKINSHLELKYRTDKELINILNRVTKIC